MLGKFSFYSICQKDIESLGAIGWILSVQSANSGIFFQCFFWMKGIFCWTKRKQLDLAERYGRIQPRMLNLESHLPINVLEFTAFLWSTQGFNYCFIWQERVFFFNLGNGAGLMDGFCFKTLITILEVQMEFSFRTVWQIILIFPHIPPPPSIFPEAFNCLGIWGFLWNMKKIRVPLLS